MGTASGNPGASHDEGNSSRLDPCVLARSAFMIAWPRLERTPKGSWAPPGSQDPQVVPVLTNIAAGGVSAARPPCQCPLPMKCVRATPPCLGPSSCHWSLSHGAAELRLSVPATNCGHGSWSEGIHWSLVPSGPWAPSVRPIKDEVRWHSGHTSMAKDSQRSESPECMSDTTPVQDWYVAAFLLRVPPTQNRR